MTDPLIIDVPEQLVGPRVVIRCYRPGDGRALHDAVAESRDSLREWMPWADGHMQPEDSEVVIRGMIARWTLREELCYGVFRRDDGAFLGSSGLHRIDWTMRRFEIGYWLRDSARGNGYVTEAACLLRDMAFAKLDAIRVCIICGAPNLGSAAVARRTGFMQEGLLRADAVRNGSEICDKLIFGMTREEWTKL